MKKLQVPDILSANDSEFALVKELSAGARILGIGEGAHFVREFGLIRCRLVQYLFENCGFNCVALETDAVEARLLSQWARGVSHERDFPEGVGPLTRALYGEFLDWLREYNAGRNVPIEIVGDDLPNSLNLAHQCEAIMSFLNKVDAEAGVRIEPILSLAAKVKGGSAAVTSFAWTALDETSRNAVIATLARVRARMGALKYLYAERDSLQAFEGAVELVDSAQETALTLQAMGELFSGAGLSADTSLREYHMARRLMQRINANNGARVLLLAHNNHIQKTPVAFEDVLTAFPAGFYLSRWLGRSYRSIGLTHLSQQTPEMNMPAPQSVVGFTVDPLEIGIPVEGSIEAALIADGFTCDISFVDLRNVDGTSSWRKMRSQSGTVTTPVHEAFDAIFVSPTATLSSYATF